jgi:hypothetical protein
MARKNKNNIENETIDIIQDAEVPALAEMPPTPIEPEPQKPVATKYPSSTHQAPVPPKKRIRIRPSQKKKLSVAVLCTNPLTRRFI